MAAEPDARSINVISTKNGDLQLDTDALAEVLCQPAVEDNPVAVVGIAGRLRTGKSFMLSFLMRYLRMEGWKNPAWIGGDDDCADDGIGWKGGRKPHTKGICIWKDVFTVEKINGEKLAVLLVDTQGLFEKSMNREQNTKLFTLTVLLCSRLMVNLKDQIDEEHLSFLQFFTEYARTATQESRDEIPFQDLIFLLRDWQYPHDNPYGLDGGESYLSDILEMTGREETDSVRRDLRSTFQSIKCFLMPHPGDSIKKVDFVGRNSEIKDEFLDHVQGLAPMVFDPSTIKERVHNRRTMTGRCLWSLLKSCSEAFEAGIVPKVENMVSGFAKMRNRFACEDGIKIFKALFREKQENTDSPDLDEIYSYAHNEALQHFEKNTRFGDESYRQTYRLRLISECQEHFKQISKWDDFRKIRAINYSLQKLNEVWTKYKENMRQDMRDQNMLKELLENLHKRHFKAAQLDYQTETVKEAAFFQDHQELLEVDIEHSFIKLRAVNEEWCMLETLGSQPDFKQEYEGYLLFLEITKQYREELEKFSTMYVEEERLTEQIKCLQQSYQDIFEKNWDREGPIIHSYRDNLLTLLEKEYLDCMRQNKRNKEVFQSIIKECTKKANVKHIETMHRLIEKSYCAPSDLAKAHNLTVEKLTQDLKTELAEIDATERGKVLEKVQEDFVINFGEVKRRNEQNKQEYPAINWKAMEKIVTTITRKIAVRAIRQFTAILKKSAHSAGKSLLSAQILPSSEAIAAVAPYLAIGAAAVAVTSVAVYCVYKHYENRKAIII